MNLLTSWIVFCCLTSVLNYTPLPTQRQEVMNGDFCDLSLFIVLYHACPCRLLQDEPLNVQSVPLSVYLFPRAVIRVGVKSHQLRLELLYDLLILVQQTRGYLVGAATIRPTAVPAG